MPDTQRNHFSALPLAGLAIAVAALAQPGPTQAEEQDPFLHGLYDRLHDSPEQRYYRELAPMPLGAVYVERPGDGDAEMRWHFRTMRELGYTALKQVLLCEGTDENRVAQLALDEGVWPWWYGEAGWARLTPELLSELGLPPDTPVRRARTDPRVIEHMTALYRDRAARIGLASGAGEHVELSPLEEYYYSKSVIRNLPDLADEAYTKWCKDQYGTLDALNHAHNRHHAGLDPAYTRWEDAAQARQRPRDRAFARIRDEFRFRADGKLKVIARRVAEARAAEPLVPFRRGGEIALFLSMPLRGVDMEGIADLMTPGGCFYPSVHLEWHFNEVEHEITRPVYMHASWATDMFKGGWSFGVETTGGPQQHSGDGQAFTVDDGTMTQLMLSYLAGGFRGFGIWCWNSRTAGLEGGEYALLGRNNEITPRARQVGRLGQAARRWRDELWDAHKEPLVGVFYDWDNEAVWAAMSNRGRDDFAFFATHARIGLSRALINSDTPFEYVTADDLRAGLAPRYRVIVLPAVIALGDDLWPVLESYVAQGGRLVLDMPGGHMNQRAALIDTGRGSRFEKLFGVVLRDHQGAGVNRSWSIDGREVRGWIADLVPTSARTLTEFDHGAPAATEARHGDGAAVLLAWEACRECLRPGHDDAEQALLRHALGDTRPPHACDDAILYRLASPAADHYFFINDGEAATVAVTAPDAYSGWTDAVTGESIDDLSRVALPRHSGRWLRAAKR